jgi:hypothetical protein
VLSAVQRISEFEEDSMIRMSDFKVIGIAIIGSFSQPDKFYLLSATADSSCGELSGAKHP